MHPGSRLVRGGLSPSTIGSGIWWSFQEHGVGRLQCVLSNCSLFVRKLLWLEQLCVLFAIGRASLGVVLCAGWLNRFFVFRVVCVPV